MNFKKSMFYVSIIILFIIGIYNYLVLPLTYQYNRSGMKMHMGMNEMGYSYYSYNGDSFGYFMLLLIIMGIVLFALNILIQRNKKSCSKCGFSIENEKWRICPNCGNKLIRRGEKKQ